MAEFSDPEWWPKPPPKPPAQISLPTIVFRALVPLVALGAVLTLLLTRHGHAAPGQRSVAAFARCVRSPASDATAGHGEASAAAPASCAGFLPPGSGVGSLGPAHGRQAQFESCLQGATSHLPHGGFGGDGGGPSAIFRAAAAACRTLGRGDGLTATTARAPSALPKA